MSPTVKQQPQKESDKQKQRSVLDDLIEVASDSLNSAPEEIKQFIGGVLVGPFMMGKSRAYEYYSASLTQLNFYLSTGLVFLVGAAIPGDGNLRFLEGTISVLLLARGIRALQMMGPLVAGLLGMMVGDALTGLQPGQLTKGLKTGWSIVSTLIKAKSATAGTQVEAGNVATQDNPRSAVPEVAAVAPPQNDKKLP